MKFVADGAQLDSRCGTVRQIPASVLGSESSGMSPNFLADEELLANAHQDAASNTHITVLEICQWFISSVLASGSA